MATFANFTNQYSVQKTLRFELIPQGKTQEHIDKKGFIKDDEQRNKDYHSIKKIIDDLHKTFIEKTLEQVEFDWTKLAAAIFDYRKNKNDTTKKTLNKEQERARKEIIGWFEGKKGNKEFQEEQKDFFSKIFKKELFSDLLKKDELNLNEDTKNVIETFDKFTTYFNGFHENRKNMYSSEAKSTSIAYRLVNENFSKFLSNCEAYAVLKEICPELLVEAEQELKSHEAYNDINLAEIFTINGFNKFLNQTNIDYYNQLIGGITKTEGTRKIRGINEIINNAIQQNLDLKSALKNKQCNMVQIFKQILSDKNTFSFVAEQFKEDQDVIDAVIGFNDEINQNNTLEAIRNIFTDINKYDKTKIYIASKELSNVSMSLLGQWSKIREIILNAKLTNFGDELSKTKKETIEREVKNKDFSVAELSIYNDQFLRTNKDTNQIEEMPIEKIGEEIIKATDDVIEKANELKIFEINDKSKNDEKQSINLDKDRKQIIKDVLDAYEELLHLLNCFKVNGDNNVDLTFYAPYELVYEEIRNIIPLYNKVRNYATKKPYSVEKFKLNFAMPTLASGWDKNKERENGSVILLKDGQYYLGIIDKENNKIFLDYQWDGTGECYQKMEYKQIATPTGVGGFIRKCFKTAQEYGWQCPDDCLNSDGKIIIKDEEAKNNLKAIIDCQKDFFDKYEKEGFKYKEFEFNFKPSSKYEKLSDFYRDVELQGYKISYTNIAASYINDLVESGKLHLFKIYNKDFSANSTGKPNLHTMYWKMVFAQENLQDVVIKLNGGAELFYRAKSKMSQIQHKIGEKMVNRINANDEPIADAIYKEIYEFANGRIKEEELSAIAQKELPLVTIKNVKHEIIKDKRFLKDKFFFHVPITLNHKADNKHIRFNEQVRKFLKNNPDINVIGIDRGERNLIYIVVIDQKGNIIDKEQVSYNTVNGFDYYAKLNQREHERVEAKQAWDVVGKIKELKEGYLSLVVREIADMMIKYNAIVVMENLNVGFKRVRGGIAEKAVYQKFEKMLIDKLNYLVFKEAEQRQAGGVLNAYQLTDKFESFEKLGNQSGFLFYVPAAYTSKIDPVTGFANVLSTKNITNTATRKEFICNFNSLIYDEATDKFILELDYERFKQSKAKVVAESHIKKWKIIIGGKRIVYNSKERTYSNKYPCEELKTILNAYEIDYGKGNIIETLADISSEKENAKLFEGVYWSIMNTLQMRNSNASTGEDYIVSAVADKNGKIFDSRTCGDELPKDADANGAYHIALKGLYLLQKINNAEDVSKIDMSIKNEDWFKFVQLKEYAEWKSLF